jgi:hypothetical protein
MGIIGPCGFLQNSLIIGRIAAFVSLKSYDSDEDVWNHPYSEMSWLQQEWHKEN